MKARILLILCLFLSLSAMGQGIVQGPITRTCPTCGKARTACTYKGKHPTCSVCKKIIGAKANACAYGGKHPTCSVCQKIIGAKTNGCPNGGKHPEAAGYDVTISCNVPSATLYIDGTANGTASGTRFLKTGSHSVRATASGYNDYSSTITVNKQSTSFRITMERKPEPAKPVVATTGTVNGHEWVDLGLPSGTKWATTNVGASSPSDYGNYYAWSETSTKSSYDRSNLRYYMDSTGAKFSKYVTDSEYGTVDGKKELDPSDDAAYVNWGSGWRMPSYDQIKELKEKCKWTWTTMGGHNGYKVVGPNGNSLFLPAAGCRSGSELYNLGSYGFYWSRSLCLDYQWYAYRLDFYSGNIGPHSISRYYGQGVRAVLAH